MSEVRFDVTVRQVWTEKYRVGTDDGGEKDVEFERDGEIRGHFYDWEQVESFTNNVLSGFKNVTVEIKIIRDGE